MSQSSPSESISSVRSPPHFQNELGESTDFFSRKSNDPSINVTTKKLSTDMSFSEDAEVVTDLNKIPEVSQRNEKSFSFVEDKNLIKVEDIGNVSPNSKDVGRLERLKMLKKRIELEKKNKTEHQDDGIPFPDASNQTSPATPKRFEDDTPKEQPIEDEKKKAKKKSKQTKEKSPHSLNLQQTVDNMKKLHEREYQKQTHGFTDRSEALMLQQNDSQGRRGTDNQQTTQMITFPSTPSKRSPTDMHVSEQTGLKDDGGKKVHKKRKSKHQNHPDPEETSKAEKKNRSKHKKHKRSEQKKNALLEGQSDSDEDEAKAALTSKIVFKIIVANLTS